LTFTIVLALTGVLGSLVAANVAEERAAVRSSAFRFFMIDLAGMVVAEKSPREYDAGSTGRGTILQIHRFRTLGVRACAKGYKESGTNENENVSTVPFSIVSRYPSA
jgi:hypothetical protein